MERIIGALVAIALAILAVGNTLSNSGQAKSDQKSGGAATDIGYVMTKARAGFAQSNTGLPIFRTRTWAGLLTEAPSLRPWSRAEAFSTSGAIPLL